MNKRTKIAIAVATIVIALFGAGGFVALSYADFPIASAELPKVMEEAKAAGVPLLATDVKVPGQVFASEKDVEEMARYGPSGDLKLVANTMSNLTSSKPDWDAANTLFPKHYKDIDRLRQIADKGGVCTPKDWDLGASVEFPEFAGAKAAAKALASHAILSAKRADIKSVVADLKRARRLGRASAESGTLIGILVQIAIDTITFRAAEVCMALLHDRNFPVDIFRKEVLTPTNYDYPRALRSEAYFQVSTTRNLKRYGGLTGFMNSISGSATAAPKGPVVRGGVPSDMVSKAFMTRSLQFWTRIFKSVEWAKGDTLAITRKLEVETKEIEGKKGLSYKLLEIMLPVFSQAGLAGVKGEADLRCKIALSQVLDYELKHGKFPPDLKTAGVTALDPFDNRPLRYRAGSTDVRVWSIGVDSKDNDGVSNFEKKTGSRTKDVDVVGAYPYLTSAAPPVQKK